MKALGRALRVDLPQCALWGIFTHGGPDAGLDVFQQRPLFV